MCSVISLKYPALLFDVSSIEVPVLEPVLENAVGIYQMDEFLFETFIL